jgi:hypothetical protein
LTERHDLAGKLMTGNQWEGGTSIVSAQNFDIGVANPAGFDSDRDFARTGLGIREVFQGNFSTFPKDDCAHGDTPAFRSVSDLA